MHKKSFLNRRHYKRKKLFLSLLLCILSLGIGYSIISTNLSIAGIIGLYRYGKPYIERDSWAEIIENVQNGHADRYNVGDEKEVDMGTLGKHTLRIKACVNFGTLHIPFINQSYIEYTTKPSLSCGILITGNN